jgi:hypothetical protein
MLESADSPHAASGPEVVPRKIVKVATAKNPRARYALDAVITRAFQR